MIIVLFFLNLFLLASPVSAQEFTYQFKLENNSINLDFTKIKTPLSNPEIELSQSKSVLSFTYKIETKQKLPADIPVFIVVFDKKVIFTADASQASNSFHTAEIDLKNFNLNDHDQLPVFYQNNFFEGYKTDLFGLNFIKEPTVKSFPVEINDLNVIREKDDSLTIVFSVQEKSKNIHSYQLFCLDKQQKIANSIELIQNDNFLWPEFSFLNFYANQKNELIFHLTEFSCDGEVYVVGDEFFESNKTSIINLDNL